MNTILFNHVSPETAYVQDNYPWGFRQKTKRRIWVEYRKGYGYRLCSQTLDPKRLAKYQDESRSWCEVKRNGYVALMFLTLNTENNHVETVSLDSHASAEEIQSFEETWKEAIEADEHAKLILRYLKARRKAEKNVKYEIKAGSEAEGPAQSLQEQAEIMRKLTLIEMKKM